MFQALNAASPTNKYKIAWAELAPVQMQGVIPGWFTQLKKNKLMGGTMSSERKKLANEFYALLHTYKQIVQELSPDDKVQIARQDTKIRWYQNAYREKFKSELTPPQMSPAVKMLVEKKASLTNKLKLLDEKHQLVNYWICGVDEFPEHREGSSTMFQYMGNASSQKVRLFLEVLCSDAEKAVSLQPEVFKSSFEISKGLETAGDNGKLSKVTWTDTAFKKAVKAEIGASYGVKASGMCELEFKGLKATLEGEAWAGIRAGAEGEASWSQGQGGTIRGKVEAEIGVKLTGSATLDCADIFICEASAEAFAGAMANAEVEISVRVDGITVKVGAEAFAGAKLTGKAAMTLRWQGYDILKSEAEGSLTAGIGAKFGLEFEATAFGGSKLKIDAGTTLGIGAEASTAFTLHADNIARAMHSCYYTIHLQLLGQTQKKETWKKYFRELEDNKVLFERARDIIEEHMKIVILERNALFNEYMQLKEFALFRETGTVRPKVGLGG